MAGPDTIDIRFRLPDGNDIGPNRYPAETTVRTLKEHVIEQWPQENENGPKTIRDVKLIYAGHVLEDSRTFAESRSPVSDRHTDLITILVVLRPPVPHGHGLPPNPHDHGVPHNNDHIGGGCSCGSCAVL